MGSISVVPRVVTTHIVVTVLTSDNKMDTMLDDLQSSVQGGETHGYKNGYNGHTSREYQERQQGNTREVREKMTRTAGGPGEGYSYREESQFMSTSSHTTMGSKKAVG